MNGFQVTVSKKGEDGANRFNIPDGVVILCAPLILCLFPFLPIRASIRFRFGGEFIDGPRITVYPLWRIAYGHYRKWRMGRYRGRK